MNLNLIEKYIDLIEEDYRLLGLRFQRNKDFHEIILNHCTIGHKIIKPIPREVKITPVLAKKLKSYSRSNVVRFIINSAK